MRSKGVMSALGQKQTSAHVEAMSALPLKADMDQRDPHVRFVPQALRPLMIKLGSRHAAMKNNPNEAMAKRYVAQDSTNFTLALDRSNSDAAISQAASGNPMPRTNIRSED